MSSGKRQSERISARDAKRHCPDGRVKKQSARDAWFDKTEETLAALWEYGIQELDKVAPCRAESKGSFNGFAQYMADELAPGVIKIVNDSDSEEDPCEDVPDDEVTDEGDGEEEESEEEEETEESELPEDALESDSEDEEEDESDDSAEDDDEDDEDDDDEGDDDEGEGEDESGLAE